jgi:hypothetical protein
MDEPFACPTDVGGDEAIVHVASLCMAAPLASPIRAGPVGR